MTAPTEEWQLETTHIGRRVMVYDCIDSTNTLAASMTEQEEMEGVALLAREQSAGRGQHGRSWSSPPGSSVLMSVILFPPPPLRRPAILTSWAAVAVCDTIQFLTDLEATIKWPNDVLIDGKKVCGILIEQRRGTVAGIGLNLNQTEAMLYQADLPQATSLAICSGKAFHYQEVAELLLQQLDSLYDQLVQGHLEELETRWTQRLGLLHEQVHVECHWGNCCGWLEELSLASIKLREADGRTHCLQPEEIRHIHRA